MLIKDAIMHNNDKTSIQIVTKNENNNDNDNNENNTKNNITLDDIIMQEDHNTLIIDSLKKTEENTVDKIMEIVIQENKKEEKMKTTFNLKRKYNEIKSKIFIQLKKSRKQREKSIFYDKNKNVINIQHTNGYVRVCVKENDVEYLGKALSHPRDRFQHYNKAKEMKKKKKKIITKLNI